MLGRRLAVNAICVAGALLYALYAVAVAARSGNLGFVTIGGRVIAVEMDGPAARAGLRIGDRIAAVGGVAAPDVRALEREVQRLTPGETVSVAIVRGEDRFVRPLRAVSALPIDAVAGIFMALMLSVVAFAARHTVFQRITAIYVVTIAGVMLLCVVVRRLPLLIPFWSCIMLTAPATCHHMLLFPGGRPLSRRALLLLYAPAVLLGLTTTVGHVLFCLNLVVSGGPGLNRLILQATIVLSIAYVLVGVVARARRLRRRRKEIDPIAVRWIALGGAIMVTAGLACFAWMWLRPVSFLGGGYRALVGSGMAGGSACIIAAMSRERFGDLDRLLRRGAGFLLATGVATAVVFPTLILLGGNRPEPTGLGMVGLAVVSLLLAPLGARLQRQIDGRFLAEQARTRERLGHALVEAGRTLELTRLYDIIATGVREATRTSGCALFARERQGFRRAAVDGTVDLPEVLSSDDELSGGLRSMLTSGEVRRFARSQVGIPFPTDHDESVRQALPELVLVVQTSEDAPFDAGHRELLATAVTGLSVALTNAVARTKWRRLSEREERHVAQLERRRQEIAQLTQKVSAERNAVEAELRRVAGAAAVIGEGLRPTYGLVERAAGTDATVIVSGETGTGKELVARALHAGSPRRTGPFVVVDCSAVPGDLFETALFGHERGAFTGASTARIGAFRAAHGGTLFLDEIGELSPDLQPKLLRVLQERQLVPVGGARAEAVDVRVVAATHRDLEREARAGRFRADLLYRLNVIAIEVPPLRARREDIPELAVSFLKEADRRRRCGRPQALSAEAIEVLVGYDWPGNVRELKHVIEAAAILCQGDEIGRKDLHLDPEIFRRKAKAVVAGDGPSRSGLRATLATLERDRLLEVLADHEGNQSAAAKTLGMTRTSLRRRMARYGLLS